MRLKSLLTVICTSIITTAAIIVSPYIDTSVLRMNIIANAEEEKYTSGFWTYVKHKDNTIGIAAYAGFDENIDIPSEIEGMKVTTIEDNAFFNNKNIKRVTIPNTVYYIGYMAFAGSGLTNIVIPDTVTSWGESGYWTYFPTGDPVRDSGNGAFAQCENLKKVVINTEVIPKWAFKDCINLNSVTLGEQTKKIEDSAFENDAEITSFQVKSNLMAIGNNTFFNCKKMKYISLGTELQSMGYMAFAGSGLTSIDIPDTVVSWGESGYWTYFPTGSPIRDSGNGAFAQCENLERAVINSETIPKWIFQDCKKLNNVTLGEKTKYIEEAAFKNDMLISNLKIQSNLYKIGNEAFYNCKNIKHIPLGDRLQSVGYMAFAGSGLIDITIPDTVKLWENRGLWKYYPSGIEIDYWANGALAECDNLVEVNIGYAELPKDIFYGSQNINVHCMKDTLAYNYAVENNYKYTLYNPIPATSVKLATDAYTLVKRDILFIPSITLYPILTPENSTDTITWESGNENMVTIDNNNVVTGKAAGLVGARCITTSGKAYTFTINVVNQEEGVTTIEKEPVKNISVSEIRNVTDKIYTGNAVEQEIKVMFNPCKELIPDVDYTVSYKNNINVGTATVTITGKGCYTGTISKTYKIEASVGTDQKPVPSEITEIKSEIYTDRITINWKEINNATGYNIYVNNKKINDKPVKNTTYIIKGLDKNTSYNISITTVNTAGESEKSQAVSIKTGNILLGDIDKNGKINIVDAMRVFHYVSGRNKDIDISLADINEDGKVNIIDAMKVFHYVSGRNTEI